MLFEDDDYNINFSIFKIPGMVIEEDKRDDNLFTEKEGFMRGNMFKDLYKPYKNYNYLPLRASSEKDKKLLDIMALSFAINDLNLYLDLHPQDTDAYSEFKKYCSKLKQEQSSYEKLYGPLEINQNDGSKYNWEENPWPWDNEGGNMYV